LRAGLLKLAVRDWRRDEGTRKKGNLCIPAKARLRSFPGGGGPWQGAGTGGALHLV